MAKIIKVANGIVSVGMDDGSLRETSIDSLNYAPKVGDDVDVFQSGNNIMVSKREGTMTSSKRVKKVTYCLLAFFLGGIVVHKFYSGKSGTGILYLIFCWTGIPSIIAFIDFIIGLNKTADSQGFFEI